MAILALLLPLLFIVGQLPWFDRTLQSLVFIALLGVPMSGLFVLPNPMVGDIIDEDETRTGLRREGIYFGVEETVTKVGFAVSTVIFGLVLQTFGYSADAPLGIRLVGPVAGVGVLLGLLLFVRGYRLADRIDPGGDPALTIGGGAAAAR